MPLYEYQCENCGEVFELIQKFSDEPTATHEKCGGNVHRLISAPALQFKGSGWYITDYAKSGSAANGGKKDGEGSATASDKKEASGSTKDSGASSGASSDTSKTGSATNPSKPAASSDKN
jgi:putative FmdB family regulatory protein